MKKYIVAVIMTFLFAFAASAPVFAATNPFVDVPEGHWAYDAINMLAANGVISGYPDGAYKGRQPVTRYEMASSLARALAAADMVKADAAELEVISRLAVEFEDEFYALGLRTEELSGELAAVREGVDGWFISGSLLMDAAIQDSHPEETELYLARARLNFDRWFGAGRSIYFHAAIEDGPENFQSFYAEFPVWNGGYVTTGRFSWDLESPYNFNTGGVSDLGVASYLTDRDYDGFGFTQQFSAGMFRAYVQREPEDGVLGYDALEMAAMASLQFTEKFGLDLGAQYFHGDDASVYLFPEGQPSLNAAEGEYRYKLNSLYTLFGGLRFNFTNNIAMNGIYYHQELDEEYSNNFGLGGSWTDEGYNAEAYRINLNLSQELLGFTSLWLGYDFTEAGFQTFNGDGEFVIDTRGAWEYDMTSWRAGATQQWNDQWRTWLYFAHHTLKDAVAGESDADGRQFGLGVEYRHNDNVAFAVNYVDSDFKNYDGYYGDDHLFRFRTQVDF